LTRTSPSTADILTAAVWCAAVFGVIEGVLLTVSRSWPRILAPYKASAHLLWIAPVVDIGLFAAAACVLAAGLARVPRLRTFGVISGVFLFAGIATVLLTLKVMHIAAALILALGLTAAASRRLHGREAQTISWLRRRTLAIPVAVIVLAGTVAAWNAFAERRRFGRLPPGGNEGGSPPNVLIVVLDTVRSDLFAADNGRLTPELHRFAARGVTFSNAWASSSWSLPSQASILAGKYPQDHGADWPSLGLKSATLAEVLASRGYVTGAFSGNSAWVTPEFLGKGFLRFRAYTFEDHVRRTTNGRVLNRISHELGFHPAGRGKKAPAVNAQFLQFLATYPGRPFFAYLCLMDVNQAFHHERLNRPFWARRASVEEELGAYESALRTLDTQIAQLLTQLDRSGLLQNTIVVITSDHGESFGKGNRGDHDPGGHGTSLYPEQTRVPLVVVAPQRVVAGRVIDTPVSLKEIPATIGRLLGIDTPSFGDPLPLDSGASVGDPAVLTTLFYDGRNEQSLTTSRWFYRRDAVAGTEELYDLAADPTAQRPRTSADPQLTILRERCERMLRQAPLKE
jgi:arylsulfatase A-like enzyme